MYGLAKVLSKYDEIDLEVFEKLSEGPRLTVTRIRDYLEAYSISKERGERRMVEVTNALAKYAVTGGAHVIH